MYHSVPPADASQPTPRPPQRQTTAALFFGPAPLPWAVIVGGLGLGAVLVELGAKIAVSVGGDPLPGPEYVVAQAAAALTPLFNVIALGPGRWGDAIRVRVPERRLLAICGALTAFSMLVAAAASVLLGPGVLLASALFFWLGIPALALSQPLLVVVGAYHAGAIAHRWGQLGPAVTPARRNVAWATALLTLAAALVLYVRPVAVGALLGSALREGHTAARDEPAVRALRFLRGDGAVLTLAYRSRLPFWEAVGASLGSGNGLDSGAWSFGGSNRWTAPEDAKRARRLYFLLTGRPFADSSVPWTVRNQRPLDWVLDMHAEEMAGERVGRRVPGLSLTLSEARGEVDTASHTAEYDWTLVFRNAGKENAEARADVLLPPGAVVHKVSLWINGEERPAAFAGNAKVRKAYREMVAVPVRQQRDPLLVTMPAPGKLLVQCAPVPPNGGSMKIRLGITAPLTRDPKAPLEGPDRVLFTPPAFGLVNFDLPLTLRHRFSLAGAGAPPRLPSLGWGFEGGYARSVMPSGALFAPPRLTLGGEQKGLDCGASLEAVLGMNLGSGPVDLTVAVDTGVEAGRLLGRAERAALKSALGALPFGSRVRFVDASSPDGLRTETSNIIRPEGYGGDWDRFLRGVRFVGGVDAVPALEQAVREAETAVGSPSAPRRLPAVLYVHGPAPDSVSDAAPVAEALKARRDVVLVGVQLAPRAADAVMGRLALQPNVRSFSVATFGGDRADVLSEAVKATTSRADRSRARVLSDQVARQTWREPAAPSTLRVERLVLNAGATDAWYATGGFGEEAHRAAKRASAARLVTPLSGAVVLETQADYERHGLNDGSDKPAKVDATVSPEGGTLVLIGLGLLAAGGLLRTRRKAGRPHTGP